MPLANTLSGIAVLVLVSWATSPGFCQPAEGKIQDHAGRDAIDRLISRAEDALSATRTMSYFGRYESTAQKKNSDEATTNSVEGQVWLERKVADDPRVGWKIASISRMDHASVRHEGVYAHWAFDGKVVRLIYPDKKRATIGNCDTGAHSVLLDFFRGQLVPSVFRKTPDWKTEVDRPFRHALGDAALTRQDNVAVGGVECHVIRADYESDNPLLRNVIHRYYLGVEDDLVRKIEAGFEFDGTLTRDSLTLTQLQTNIDIAAERFLPAIPESYAIRNHRLPPTSETAPVSFIQKNARFPDFELQDRAGGVHHLGRYKNRVLVIEFWGTWCGACKFDMPELNELKKQFPDTLEIIAASCNESEEADPTAYVSEREYDFLVTLNSESLADEIGVQSFPSFVVVDANGICVHSHVGHDPKKTEKLKEAVRSALAQKTPEG